MKKIIMALALLSVSAGAQISTPLIDDCYAIAVGKAVTLSFPDPAAGGTAATQHMKSTGESIKECLKYLAQLKILRTEVKETKETYVPDSAALIPEDVGEDSETFLKLGALEDAIRALQAQLAGVENKVIDIEDNAESDALIKAEATQETTSPGDGVVGVIRLGGKERYIVRLQGLVVELEAGQGYEGKLFNVINNTAFWGEERLPLAAEAENAEGSEVSAF